MMLADIESFDPDPRVSGVYSKFQCNQPACEGKPHDALHKSLSVNMETGVWHCFRCSAHGVLDDAIFDDTVKCISNFHRHVAIKRNRITCKSCTL